MRYMDGCSERKTENISIEDALVGLIDKQAEYIELLSDEGRECAVIAGVHGWKSTRYDDGVKLRDEIEQHKKRCQQLSGQEHPFYLMEDWLDAYDTEHGTDLSEDIMQWINQQDMGCCENI